MPIEEGYESEAAEDGFGPPEEDDVVRCLHCDRLYMASEMRFENRFGALLWWCKYTECDGRGHGVDILPEKSLA